MYCHINALMIRGVFEMFCE